MVADRRQILSRRRARLFCLMRVAECPGPPPRPSSLMTPTDASRLSGAAIRPDGHPGHCCAATTGVAAPAAAADAMPASFEGLPARL